MITQLGGTRQIGIGSIDLDRLSSDFVDGATWDLSSTDTAVLDGIDSAQYGDNFAASQGYVNGLIDSNMKSPDGYATVVAGDYPTDYKGSGGVAEGDVFYITSVANGTTVGSETVNVGDMLVALTDTPLNVDASWVIMESNRDQATETVKGIAQIATVAEVTAGADDNNIVTPLKLAGAISGVTKTAGNGLTDTAGTFDVVATDLSLNVNANDMQVQIGTTNGTSLEVSATGLELAQTVTGDRSFTVASGEMFVINNAVTNAGILNVSPDGTLPGAIADVNYVDTTIAASALTFSDGVMLTGSNVTLGGGLTASRSIDTAGFDLTINDSTLGGNLILGTGGNEFASISTSSVDFTLNTMNDVDVTPGNDFNVTAANDVAINATSILSLQSQAMVVVASQNNNPLILSTAGLNEAQLTQQPDGTVPLAIATTDYVDNATAGFEIFNEKPTVTGGSATLGNLAHTPTANTERVYLNGVRQSNGNNDFTITGATITFTNALSGGDIVIVDYKYV